MGLWGLGCRCGSSRSRRRLSGAPGHVVHVDHRVDGQQQVGTGDAEDVKEAVHNQAGLLRVQECSDDVKAGEGNDEDAAGGHDGSLPYHADCWMGKKSNPMENEKQ